MKSGEHCADARHGRGRDESDDRGYIMVVLLVSIAVSAVWMAAALPSWRQQVIREREAELIFRGEAYARAIQLYRQKNNQNLPPSVDILVSQKYLRRKYKDPITGKDFLVVGAVGLQQGGVGVPQTGTGVPSNGAMGSAGIIGVRSTSNDESIRIYNNQQTYSQWAFDFTLEQLKSGQGLAPVMPGGRGNTPVGPGGRGNTPVGPGGRPGGPGAGEMSPIVPDGARFGGRGPAGGATPQGPSSGRPAVPPPLPPGMAAPGGR